jgi:hypothetical protein
MITFALFMTIVLGAVISYIGIRLLKKLPETDFLKSTSDILLKLAIVMFGITAGLLGFFGQKRIEAAYERIQQANEALGNIDVIQSDYMSEIESSYWNNDGDFIEIYTKCESILKKYDDEKKDSEPNDYDNNDDVDNKYCLSESSYNDVLPSDALDSYARYFQYKMQRYPWNVFSKIL